MSLVGRQPTDRRVKGMKLKKSLDDHDSWQTLCLVISRLTMWNKSHRLGAMTNQVLTKVSDRRSRLI